MPAEDSLLFLRDLADVEPPRELYKDYDKDDIYKMVPQPQWTGLEEEVWTPRERENDPQLERVRQLIKRNSTGEGRQGSISNSGVNALSATKFATKLQRKHKSNPKVRTRKMLDHKVTEALMMIITIWALFGEDLRWIAVPKEGDIPCWILHIITFFAFLIELLLRSWAQHGYLLSFFFMLDAAATATLVPDFLPLFDMGSVQSEAVTVAGVARAGRAARAGTKIGRLLKLLRILRVLKLFLAYVKRKNQKDGGSLMVEEEKEYTPSELGKQLKKGIGQKVIAFVLILIVLSTLLEEVPAIGTPEVLLGQLWFASTGGAGDVLANPDLFASSMVEMGRLLNNPPSERGIAPGLFDELLRLDIFNRTYYDLSKPDVWRPAVDPDCQWKDLRAFPPTDSCMPRIHSLRTIGPNTEIKFVELPVSSWLVDEFFAHALRDPTEQRYETTGGHLVRMWVSRKNFHTMVGVFGMVLTIFIAALLGVMAFLFSRDADNLVIRPIESMVDAVTQLAANPAYKPEEVKSAKYETDQLRISLSKIAQLLQVGFGEAGNNLVAENLKKGDSVDPMVPGKKLLGAYGFCIIDDYEEVLECLGPDILPYTNTAADIVHKAVVANGGQPNRNLGEAFLCVWKPKLSTHDPTESERTEAETKMCDGALTAFRRCVRGVAMSGKLDKYGQNEEIQKMLGDYQTVIGYGLHYGWAIEGAVGTAIKIDCSYLSPNVNLAARLESATKMYGVNILMSEYFASKLSAQVKQGLRCVDVVCLKGSSIPMRIYTCDRSNGLYCTPTAVERHGEDGVVAEFQRVFAESMEAFISGDWQAAKAGFDAAIDICPSDKPSKRILKHMGTPENQPDFGLATTPFEAPEGWPGYHVLLSK